MEKLKLKKRIKLDPIRQKFLDLYLELQKKEMKLYKNYNPLDELEFKDKKNESRN